MAFHFHWIVPGEAARSAQVPAMLLRPFLRAHGIKTLINLRGRHPEFAWWRKEEQACLQHGVRYLNALLDSRLLPTREMLIALWACFDRAKGYPPVLIKCSGGQDRTGLAAALYLIERQGWGAMDKAQTQLERFPYLHFPRAQQQWLAVFPRFAQEQAKGASFGDWVRHGYDPRLLRSWLRKEGIGFGGIYGEPPETAGPG